MSELQSLGTFMGNAFQRIDANLEALTAILQNGVQCHCNCGGSSESNSGSIAGVDASRAGILEAEIVDGNLMVSWPKGVEFDEIYVRDESFTSAGVGGAVQSDITKTGLLASGFLTETSDRWVYRTDPPEIHRSNNTEYIVLVCRLNGAAVASFYFPIAAFLATIEG